MIVLDTQVLLWWASGSTALLASAAGRAIAAEQQEGGRLVISPISAWEVAMLVARGRVALSLETGEWLALISRIETVEFMPVDNDIVPADVDLPGQFHQDPAERMIVATARMLGAPRVTAGEKIRSYPHLRTVW